MRLWLSFTDAEGAVTSPCPSSASWTGIIPVIWHELTLAGAFNAVSSTFLVNSFSKPSGPVSAKPSRLGLGHHCRRHGMLPRRPEPLRGGAPIR
ncbi:hypothetical protein ACFVYA_49750 [Amycolatopsis sp. NPDC058278]|uniref:hypothetical protein n=1 Tax=Amycolatopsis sp. NPDC058278 TaxID=3346417 RepID=UPI0036DE9AC0